MLTDQKRTARMKRYLAAAAKIQPRGKQRRPKLKGQAIVEMAFCSLILLLLLAGAVDFGRAFYTATIVTNMAGEGAAFASIYPDQDVDPLHPTNQRCSTLTPVSAYRNIQARARLVAKDHGLIVEKGDQQSAVITVTTEGYGTDCTDRCAGRTITVSVTYTLNDLLLPKFLGFTSIPITKSASQVITRDVDKNAHCGG
jgi:Flp pilus assembly protein TadG